MTEVYDHLIDDWRTWTGILNEAQARELVKTWARRSFNQPEETEDMTKSNYVVTVPATITAVVEATDDKDASEKFRALAKTVFGNMFGVVSVVGDAKVVQVAGGKTKSSGDDDKKSDKKSSKSDDDDDDDDEDEDEEEEEEEDDDEEDGDDEEEGEDDDDDEDEKKSSKSDKKSDKKSSKPDEKKKVKIKLRGK
jgi:cobalamin biosynthesis protein CobT